MRDLQDIHTEKINPRNRHALLTIDFNKLEWFQLGGLHVEYSCSPLDDDVGASTEAPIFMAAVAF